MLDDNEGDGERGGRCDIVIIMRSAYCIERSIRTTRANTIHDGCYRVSSPLLLLLNKRSSLLSLGGQCRAERLLLMAAIIDYTIGFVSVLRL